MTGPPAMLISLLAHCVTDFGRPLPDARTPCDLLFLGVISSSISFFVCSSHSQAVRDVQGTCHVARLGEDGFELHAMGKETCRWPSDTARRSKDSRPGPSWSYMV